MNVVFTRLLLKAVHKEVRKAFPEIKSVTRVIGATTWRRGQWCVEIACPGRPRFHWDGRAHNATEAKYKAWNEFLRKHGPQEEATA